MALVAVVALLYSVEEVGLNGLLWSVALVCRMAGTIGIDSMGMKIQAPLWQMGDDSCARSYARRDVGVVAKLWLVVMFMCLISAIALHYAAGVSGLIVIALGVVGCSSAFQRLFVVQRQARNQPLLGQVMESVVLPGLGIVGVVASAHWAPDLLVLSQVAAFVIVSFCTYMSSPAFFFRVVPPVASIEWWPTLTLGLGATLTALAARVPMFLIAGQSLAAAGAYDVAQKIQSAGSLGTNAVSTVFMPRVTGALYQRDLLVRLAVSAAASSLLIPVSLLLVLLVFGEHGLVELLGEDFRDAWSAAVLLLVAAVINAATSVTGNVLMFSGRERVFTAVALAQLAIVASGAIGFGADSAAEMAIWVILGELFRGSCMLGGFVVHLKALRVSHMSTRDQN
ncbi:hypothetical protein [Kocuria rosea]|uniref:hypothetical protein n=1 Tax=Kocuria rosea TaxID=1275 RepID=UPI0011B28878|nr:hypothetical protein [Kocuria rosea]